MFQSLTTINANPNPHSMLEIRSSITSLHKSNLRLLLNIHQLLYLLSISASYYICNFLKLEEIHLTTLLDTCIDKPLQCESLYSFLKNVFTFCKRLYIVDLIIEPFPAPNVWYYLEDLEYLEEFRLDIGDDCPAPATYV